MLVRTAQANDSLYATGDNSTGQLGADDNFKGTFTKAMLPCVFKYPQNKRFAIKEIGAGRSHSAILTHQGTVFACGDKNVCGTLPNANSVLFLPWETSLSVVTQKDYQRDCSCWRCVLHCNTMLEDPTVSVELSSLHDTYFVNLAVGFDFIAASACNKIIWTRPMQKNDNAVKQLAAEHADLAYKPTIFQTRLSLNCKYGNDDIKLSSLISTTANDDIELVCFLGIFANHQSLYPSVILWPFKVEVPNEGGLDSLQFPCTVPVPKYSVWQ